MARALTVLLEEVMEPVRTHALGRRPIGEVEHRCDHANGLYPETIRAQLKVPTVALPRSRDDEGRFPPARTRRVGHHVARPGEAKRNRKSPADCIDRGNE